MTTGTSASYEAFAPDEQHPFSRQVAVLLRQMYEKWAADAEGVMARVAALQEGPPYRRGG